MINNPMWAICERVAEVQAPAGWPRQRRQAHAGGRGCEGAGDLVGAGAAAGDVRCRLLPAEHAAGRMSGRGSYAPDNGLEG
jgi:hypothetical protein